MITHNLKNVGYLINIFISLLFTEMVVLKQYAYDITYQEYATIFLKGYGEESDNEVL